MSWFNTPSSHPVKKYLLKETSDIPGIIPYCHFEINNHGFKTMWQISSTINTAWLSYIYWSNSYLYHPFSTYHNASPIPRIFIFHCSQPFNYQHCSHKFTFFLSRNNGAQLVTGPISSRSLELSTNLLKWKTWLSNILYNSTICPPLWQHYQIVFTKCTKSKLWMLFLHMYKWSVNTHGDRVFHKRLKY